MTRQSTRSLKRTDTHTFVSGRTYMNDNVQAFLSTVKFQVIDNRADGNCFLEAILDSAAKNLPSQKFASSFGNHSFSNNSLGSKRPKREAEHLRTLLVEQAKAHYRRTVSLSDAVRAQTMSNIQDLRKNKTWLNTDHLQYVADKFEICVWLYDTGLKVWTYVDPFQISQCGANVIFLTINNNAHGYRPGQQRLSGKHFVAAVMQPHDLAQFISNTNSSNPNPSNPNPSNPISNRNTSQRSPKIRTSNPSNPKSNRNTSQRSSNIGTSIQKLVTGLQNDEYIALGSAVGWPRNLKVSAPVGVSLVEARSIVRAAMRSSRLRLAMLRGTLVRPADQTALLKTIASELPRSNILCLNIGEFDAASREAYEGIVNALQLSSVGHLYWDRRGPFAYSLIAQAKGILQENRKTDFYKIEAVRAEVYKFMRVIINDKQMRGVNTIATAMLNDTSPTERCRVRCQLSRCHGINQKRLRCCLCTRSNDHYCHHHRRNPFPKRVSGPI